MTAPPRKHEIKARPRTHHGAGLWTNNPCVIPKWIPMTLYHFEVGSLGITKTDPPKTISHNRSGVQGSGIGFRHQETMLRKPCGPRKNNSNSGLQPRSRPRKPAQKKGTQHHKKHTLGRAIYSPANSINQFSCGFLEKTADLPPPPKKKQHLASPSVKYAVSSNTMWFCRVEQRSSPPCLNLDKHIFQCQIFPNGLSLAWLLLTALQKLS